MIEVHDRAFIRWWNTFIGWEYDDTKVLPIQTKVALLQGALNMTALIVTQYTQFIALE